MTLQVTNDLAATIFTTEDSSGVVPINRGLGNLAFDSNYADFFIARKLQPGVAFVLPIPIFGSGPQAYQLYVRNTDPGANICQVTYLPPPLGGTYQSSPLLAPGDVFIIWQNPAGPGAGFVGATIVSAGACLIEYFLGG
jgi:hypothetical protein